MPEAVKLPVISTSPKNSAALPVVVRPMTPVPEPDTANSAALLVDAAATPRPGPLVPVTPAPAALVVLPATPETPAADALPYTPCEAVDDPWTPILAAE